MVRAFLGHTHAYGMVGWDLIIAKCLYGVPVEASGCP